MGNIVLMLISVIVGIFSFYWGCWFVADMLFDIDISEYIGFIVEKIMMWILPIVCFMLSFIAITIGILIGLGKM